MSIWERENDEENEENEADEDEEFRSQTDRMIFLIDARAAMLETNAKGETHLQNCLAVALEAIKTKIISQDASTIGVIFFGCRAGDEGEAPGVYSLFPISTPSANNIRLLQAMIEDIGEFERLVGCQSTSTALCPLKQALWRCKLSFGTKDLKKSDFKRVWIFTNDDYPNRIYPEEQNKVVQIAKDCADGGIEISLWHCDRSQHQPFNPTLFYHRLLKASIMKDTSGGGNNDGEEEDEEMDEEENLAMRMLSGGYAGFDSSVASVRRKQFRKRRMGQLLFSFSDRNLFDDHTSSSADSTAAAAAADNNTNNNSPTNMNMMCVRMYKMIQLVKKPLHTWISMRTNEPILTSTRYLDASSGAIVPPTDIETYIAVQGAAIPMTAEDMTVIKRRDPWNHFQPLVIDKKDPLKCKIPGIRLLFCVPRSALPLHLTLSTPYFLFPGESTIKGSANLFECFLRTLLKEDLVAIVRFTRNLSAGKASPAVLVPQAEKVVDGVQMDPPGLQCIPLPCIEDLRFNPQPENVLLKEDRSLWPESGVIGQAMVQFIEHMSLDKHAHEQEEGEEEGENAGGFNYTTDIDNPSLQLFYALLQAVALNEEQLAWRPETHDTMRPKRHMLEKAQPVSLQLQQLFGLDQVDGEHNTHEEAEGKGKKPAAAPRKRAAPAVKKEKAGGSDEEENEKKAKKAKPATTATAKRGTKKVKKEEDGENDDDDLNNDDDSLAPAAKKAKTATASRTTRVKKEPVSYKEENEEEDDDEAESVATATKGRKTKTAAGKTTAGRKRKVVDDDDEDFEF